MKALAFAALLSLGAGPRREPKGLVLEQDTTRSLRSMVGMVTQEDAQRVHLSPSGVRVESSSGRGAPKLYTIFRLEPKGRVVRIEVDGRRRTYREEDLLKRAEDNEALRKRLVEDAAKARESAKREGDAGPSGMPLGLLAGGLAAPGEGETAPVEVARTEDACTIAGRKCRRFEFLQGGEKVFEAWYTEKPAPLWVRRLDLDESPGGGNVPLMRARRERKGLELRSVLYLPAGGRAETRTTKIKEKTLSASTFEPPAGYKKVAPPASARKGGTKR